MNDNNTSGFDELYMRYHRMVFGVCMSVLHNEEDARDISQEVFLRLYQWWDKVGSSEKIKGWLCVTSRNMAVNALRLKKTLPFDDDMVSCDADPERDYLTKERSDRLYGLIEKMDEKYSQVIIMRYLLDFSVKEIAAATGSVSASVYTRLRRGEKILGRMIEEAQL